MITVESTQRYARYYVGQDGDLKNPLASPLYSDMHGLPPLFIIVGDHERLLDDSTRVAEKVKAAGGEVRLEVWDEMIHIFPYFSVFPEANAAIEQVTPFLREKLEAKI